MADDVALDLGSARFDRISTRTQIGVGPKSFVGGEGITGHKLAVGTEDFLRDLLEALIQLQKIFWMEPSGPGTPVAVMRLKARI
jgi:hypothetical protein